MPAILHFLQGEATLTLGDNINAMSCGENKQFLCWERGKHIKTTGWGCATFRKMWQSNSN